MNNPKVSVIIPVYGVEKYIEKCARSLMDQTLKDVEYIFINDCTPDKSIEILESVISEYSGWRDNITIVHNQTNIGQAKSRQRGIMMARGEYVIHCDSDDWVDVQWLERLYETAKSTGADIVGCDFDAVSTNGQFKYTKKASANSLEDFLIKLELGTRMGSLCLHLIKREIVQSEKIVWPEWNYCEDLSLVFQYTFMAKKYCDVKRSLYKYRENQSSITARKDLTGVLNNIKGEISTSLQVIKFCENQALNKRHKANLLARIFRAKGRVACIASDSEEFSNLWRGINDGLSVLDIWRSSMSIKEKATSSLILLNVYSYVKHWKK